MANYQLRSLPDADFRYQDLRGTNFRWAYLNKADFTGADLRGADFSDTDLREADFTGAYLNNTTIFDRADIEGAYFDNCIEPEILDKSIKRKFRVVFRQVIKEEVEVEASGYEHAEEKAIAQLSELGVDIYHNNDIEVWDISEITEEAA